LLDGFFINYEFWMPVTKVQFRGVADLISRYQARAAAERVDLPGYSLARWGYAQLQVVQKAVEAIKTLDDAKLAYYLREQVFTAVVGDVKFGAKGEWAQTRFFTSNLRTQGIHIAQLKDMST
jgi:branched-chain amino acid transport system substrate-binding protein